MAGVTGGGRASKFSAMGAAVATVTENIVALTAAAIPAKEAMTNYAISLDQASGFAKQYKQAMSMALTGADARVSDPDLGVHKATPKEQAQAEEIATHLETFQHQIEGIFGSNNQFATFMGRTVTSIRGGADPWAALNALRQQFAAYAGGLQQEMMSQDPAIAAFAQEMERFINSGALS